MARRWWLSVVALHDLPLSNRSKIAFSTLRPSAPLDRQNEIQLQGYLPPASSIMYLIPSGSCELSADRCRQNTDATSGSKAMDIFSDFILAQNKQF